MKPQISQITRMNDSAERDPKTYAIIGAAMEVHRELGPGFLEAVYQEALALELEQRGIPFQREVVLKLTYKGKTLNCTYKADFICYERVIVETKATTGLTPVDEAQLINYLKASGYKVGLLLNFATHSLQYRRLVYS